jgi:hypothetical protein
MMASAWHGILFFLLLLFIMTNSIHSYGLNERMPTGDQSNNDEDGIFHNKINLRSVLWPKICFVTSKKRNEQRGLNDQIQQHKFNRQI